MRTEIKKLHQRLKATIVYVTHDVSEANQLADEVVVLDQGRVVERRRSRIRDSGAGESTWVPAQ